MKKILLIILTITFHQVSFGQDTNAEVKETLEWIKNKVETYPVNTGIFAVSKVIFSYDLQTFDISVYYQTSHGVSETRSNLKDLSLDMALYEGYSFKIGCRVGKCAKETVKFRGEPTVYEQSAFELVFDGEAFQKLGLEERMKKAFKEAILLSRGKLEKY